MVDVTRSPTPGRELAARGRDASDKLRRSRGSTPRGRSPVAKRTPGAGPFDGLAPGRSGRDAPDRASGRARSRHRPSGPRPPPQVQRRRSQELWKEATEFVHFAGIPLWKVLWVSFIHLCDVSQIRTYGATPLPAGVKAPGPEVAPTISRGPAHPGPLSFSNLCAGAPPKVRPQPAWSPAVARRGCTASAPASRRARSPWLHRSRPSRR